MFQNYKNELRDRFTKEISSEKTIEGNLEFNLNLDSGKTSIENYVKLFDLDFLFNSIPENITSMSITDKKGSDIDLKFDDKFKKLKNLEHLILKNCISEFPDVIKNFSKIEVISVVDPRITEVPSWVVTCSELLFLTISTQTKISLEVVEKLESMNVVISYEN